MAAAKSESEFAGDNEATASSTLVKRRKRKEEQLEGDHEESRIISNGETSGVVFRCLRRRDSPEGEDDDDGLVSYCSGDDFVDLVEDNKMGQIERRKIVDSKKKKKKKKRRVMVKEAEVEDFFAATNKDLLNQFSQKYNFDFEKEEALDGRYEWVKSKPW